MFPIRDTIPSRRIAWVTWALIVANVVAFALELRQGPALESFLYRFGVVPSHWIISSLSDFLDWPQLFLSLLTSQFLHGGFLHLGFNLLYLWIFADSVEDRLGPGWFLLLYLVGGVVSAVVQVLKTPTSAIPMIGASGAIAAVLGAHFLMFPTARIVTMVPLWLFWHTLRVPAVLFLGVWFLLQWAQGLTTIGQVADMGGTAFWAHIGGFCSGILAVLLLLRRPSQARITTRRRR